VNPSTPKFAGRRKEKKKMVYTLVYELEFVVYIHPTKGKVQNWMYEFFHFGPATTSVVKPE